MPSRYQLNLELQDLNGFERWLKMRNSQDVVGSSHSPIGSPLANYLAQKFKCGVWMNSAFVWAGTVVVENSRLGGIFDWEVDRFNKNEIFAWQAIHLLKAARTKAAQQAREETA